jgi:hypothetical protein
MLESHFVPDRFIPTTIRGTGFAPGLTATLDTMTAEGSGRRRCFERRFSSLASLGCALLLAWPTPLSAQSSRGLGLPSPLPSAERLFSADFDDLDAHAEAARGSPTASLTRRLAASPEGGAHRGALSLGSAERCRYEADRNVHPEQGTLSFWVHTAAPPRAGDPPRRFLQLQSEGAEPFVLAVDTGQDPDTLRVVVKRGRGSDRVTYQLHARAVWGQASWRRVDVSWRSDRLALYLDGAHAESLRVRDFRLPSLARGALELLPGSGGAAALDDLVIWSRALAGSEIAQLFEVTRAEPLTPPLVVAPRRVAPLRVDGRLDLNEWATASLVPVAIDAATAFAAPRFAAAYLAWDAGALRVAFVSPSSDEGEEAFTLDVSVPGTPAREHRFRVTRGDVSYRGAAAQTPGRFAQARGGETWTVEAEIPLDALAGVAPAPGSEWSLALGREAVGRSVLGGDVGWGGRAGGRLRFGTRSEGVRVFASPALSWGRPAFEVEGAAGWRAQLRFAPSAGDAVETQWRLAEPAPDVPPLPAENSGLLQLSVQDADGADLLAWSARIPARELLDAPLVPDPVGGRIGIEIAPEHFSPHWRERARARALVLASTATAPDGTRTESRAVLPEEAALQWVPSRYAPGLHRLSHRFETPEGRLLWATEREIDVPKLDWATDSTAMGDVLEPWTSLRYDGVAAAEVWGRRYEFEGPLLAAVQNQQRPLLRAPMRLDLETSAGRAGLVSVASEAVEQAPARGAWRGTSLMGATGVRVEWGVTLEYDGLIVTSLAFEPPAGGTLVERLRLEVPLRPDVVRYIRGTHDGPAIRSGRVPWNGRLWQSGFEPFVWVTNETEGFLYFSDSEANWVHPEGARVVSVRGGDDAGIALDLIQGPLHLDRRVEYQLGFQATPVKPMLPDARAWNFGNFALAPDENALSWILGWAVHDGVFEVAAPAALRTFDRGWRRRGIKPFYYGAPSATPALGATFHLFEDVWRSAYATSFAGAVAATAFHPALPPHRMVGVCPAAASFQDLLLHQAETLVRSYGVAGIYTDTDGVFADDNTLHGCGFEDAFGKRGLTFGILGKRRFAMRLAAVVRRAGPARAHWMSHAHARLVPPVYGFADFWHPGEELAAAVGRDPWFYVDALDATAWRVEYRGESSGIPHVFLPELASPPDRAASEAMLALAAVNDVNVAAAFSDRSAVGEYWELRKTLGLIDAEFVGHWSPKVPVRVSAGSATASAYRTQQGWVLVVASSLARAQTIRLRVDRSLLGSAPTKAVDARTGESVAFEADEFELQLAPRSYTYLPLK